MDFNFPQRKSTNKAANDDDPLAPFEPAVQNSNPNQFFGIKNLNF
jgi:hypothetical protein